MVTDGATRREEGSQETRTMLSFISGVSYTLKNSRFPLAPTKVMVGSNNTNLVLQPKMVL